MAALGWRSDIGLGDALHTEPQTFDFFQAVRLLSRAMGDAGEGSDELPFEFRSRSDEAFPSGEIQSIAFETTEGGDAGWSSLARDDVRVVVLDLVRTGLVGPRSPLPTAHAEWVLDEQLAAIRQREGRPALPAFLDLFGRRLTSLEYRSKESSCQALESRRPQHSRLGERLFSLMGLRHYDGKFPVSRGAVLAVAGLLANRRPSKAKLQKILRLWLDLPLEVNDHRGGWRKVDPAHHTVLGRSSLVQGQILGKRAWLQQGILDLTLRSVRYSKLLEFIPKSPFDHPEPREKIRSSVGLLTEFRWPTRLTITTPWKGVPRSRLFKRWQRTPVVETVEDNPNENPYMLLGRTSWLKSRHGDVVPLTDQKEVSTTLELEPRLPSQAPQSS